MTAHRRLLRPTRSASSQRAWLVVGVSCLGALVACTETPLDATLLETDEPPLVDEVPKCTNPEPELNRVYSIVSKPSGRCLRSGEVTDIEGATAATGYTVELVACTGASDQEWLLSGSPSQSHIQHVDLGLNLDLEAGSFSDGTEALLYEPHGGRNQTFTLKPLADGAQEIRASFADGGCLEAMLVGENAVELQRCPSVAAGILPRQNWFFTEVDCDE